MDGHATTLYNQPGRDDRDPWYDTYVSWIVQDADTLGGQLRIRGTRLSVSFVLECLSQGMTADEIARDYPGFPPEAIPEVLHLASQVL